MWVKHRQLHWYKLKLEADWQEISGSVGLSRWTVGNWPLIETDTRLWRLWQQLSDQLEPHYETWGEPTWTLHFSFTKQQDDLFVSVVCVSVWVVRVLSLWLMRTDEPHVPVNVTVEEPLLQILSWSFKHFEGEKIEFFWNYFFFTREIHGKFQKLSISSGAI